MHGASHLITTPFRKKEIASVEVGPGLRGLLYDGIKLESHQNHPGTTGVTSPTLHFGSDLPRRLASDVGREIVKTLLQPVAHGNSSDRLHTVDPVNTEGWNHHQEYRRILISQIQLGNLLLDNVRVDHRARHEELSAEVDPPTKLPFLEACGHPDFEVREVLLEVGQMIDDFVMVSEMVDVRNGVANHHEKGIHPVPQGSTHLGLDSKDVSVLCFSRNA